MSLVIFFTSVVTLFGKPDQSDRRLARKVDLLGDLHRHVNLLALVDARGREGQPDIGRGNRQVGELRRDR